MSRPIAHLITPSRMAGAETLLVRLAARQMERDLPVRIAVNKGARAIPDLQRLLEEKSAGMVPLDEINIGGKFHPRALATLLNYVRVQQPRLLHSHLSSASWWCGWLDHMGRVPSVGHVHGFTSALWHRRQRRLIAVSEAVKRHLVEQGIAPDKIVVLPNPVDPRDVPVLRPRSVVRVEMGATEDTLVVGSFAHLSEKKGWIELLAAVPQVVRQVPNAQFWWAGAGPLRPLLEKQIAALGLEDNVKLLGFRRDAPALMAACDVMVLPSHREPFGLVYVEANLHGVPVIACNSGGAPEVVQHEHNGLLVPPKDPAALAEAIILLLCDRAGARRLGAQGKEIALDRFNWNRFLNDLDKVYESLDD